MASKDCHINFLYKQRSHKSDQGNNLLWIIVVFEVSDMKRGFRTSSWLDVNGTRDFPTAATVAHPFGSSSLLCPREDDSLLVQLSGEMCAECME